MLMQADDNMLSQRSPVTHAMLRGHSVRVLVVTVFAAVWALGGMSTLDRATQRVVWGMIVTATVVLWSGGMLLRLAMRHLALAPTLEVRWYYLTGSAMCSIAALALLLAPAAEWLGIVGLGCAMVLWIDALVGLITRSTLVKRARAATPSHS